MRAVLFAASVVIAAACGNSKAAGEIECQRRLTGSPSVQSSPATQPGRGLASGFAAWNQYYREIALDGCTDGQRYQASALARVAGQVSAAAGAIGDPLRAMEQDPALRSNSAFMELQARIEEFERRRELLRRELDRMISEER